MGKLNPDRAILVGEIELAQAAANVLGGYAYDRVISGVIGGIASENLDADGAFLNQFTPLQGPVHDVAKEDLTSLAPSESAAFKDNLQFLADLTNAVFRTAKRGFIFLLVYTNNAPEAVYSLYISSVHPLA